MGWFRAGVSASCDTTILITVHVNLYKKALFLMRAMDLEYSLFCARDSIFSIYSHV